MSVSTAVVERLTIGQLAKREKVHVATCWRWILHGVGGAKHRSFRVGGRRYVANVDWQDFCDAVNADLREPSGSPTPDATARSKCAGVELDHLLNGTSRRRDKPNA